MSNEEDLDFTPLQFGKYKGNTPDQLASLGGRPAEYLIWAYETVSNFDVCSEALYRDLGGRGKRAVKVVKPAREESVWVKKNDKPLHDANRDISNNLFDEYDDDDLPF